MTLLFGTHDGVYRVDGADQTPERVLDCSRTVALLQDENDVYAASRSGLYRSVDGGDSWRDLAVPALEVWAVHRAADGELFAGCYPAELYRSNDDGATWEAVDGLQTVPHREQWFSPQDDTEGHVRAIATHPDVPTRLLVGIEVGGLYRSDDGGASWADLEGVEPDVHHVLVRGPEEYVVACGRLNRKRGYGPAGLYRTADGGDSWRRFDLGEHTYVRETLVHGGTLYAAGSRTHPGDWHGGADGALFESDDGGDTFERLSYPGEPEEVVLSWTVDDGDVFAGTGTRPYDADCRLLRRDSGGWTDVCGVPGAVFALTGV